MPLIWENFHKVSWFCEWLPYGPFIHTTFWCMEDSGITNTFHSTRWLEEYCWWLSNKYSFYLSSCTFLRISFYLSPDPCLHPAWLQAWLHFLMVNYPVLSIELEQLHTDQDEKLTHPSHSSLSTLGVHAPQGYSSGLHLCVRFDVSYSNGSAKVTYGSPHHCKRFN